LEEGMAEDWYYATDGKTVGPFAFESLQLMASAGTLSAEDQVTSDGQTWRPAREVPGLDFGGAGAAAPLGYQSRASGLPKVTPLVIELFKQTSVWVRVMAILLMIGTGFMVLGAGGMFVVGLISRRETEQMLLLAALYLVLAAFYGVPAILLFRYASRFSAFANLRHEKLLEDAMQAQKTFWKWAVILILIGIGLYILAIIGVVAFSAMRHMP
jgi:hypothetical protein